MSTEFILYTDESVKSGKYFANFYGGALVRSGDLELVQTTLKASALAAGLTAEIKWQKVSSGYLDRYVALMESFFDLIAADKVKLRIMFTQTRYVPTGLSKEQRENTYQLLYYQFLKHAFGLQFSNVTGNPVRLRIILDQLPDTNEKNARFKGYIAGLQRSSEFRAGKIEVPQDQISEVRSHDHIALQCLDVVLGAMQFRLNDHHLEKAAETNRRGARTIAKEKLYKHINARIRQIYPNFNIGISTGTDGAASARWSQPYRHWLFLPKGAEVDNSRAKRKS